MRNFKILGITGPTGSGKTTVTDILKDKNYGVIKADVLAHEVLTSSTPCINALICHFGKDILNKDNTINKKVLASKAFKSKEETSMLNKITHPYIFYSFFKEAKEYIKKGFKLIVFDAPVLLESHGDIICDYIVSVISDKSIRIKRIMDRDNISKKEATLRMQAQKDDDFYISGSDFVIYNNDDINNLKIETLEMLKSININ